MESGSFREQLISFALEEYGARLEHPWRQHADHEALTHADTGKMFALVANVAKKDLGLTGNGRVDIVTVKVGDRFLAESLAGQDGYFPGLPLRRGGWVSISLMGDVPFEDVCMWLRESCFATASKTERERMRPPKEWIVPANPKYYDVIGAFDAAEEIDWKQGRGIRVGDTVFMYVAAPYSAILFKCEVTETGIPFVFNEGDVHMRELMRIRLLRRYSPEEFPLSLMAKYGVTTVRGPRGVPVALSKELAR